MRSWNYFPTRVAMATARGRRAVTGVCRRHQVTELPPIEAHITEFQCPEVVCPACGKTTQAPVPDEVKRQCGAQLTALIAYLTVVCRLPRRVVQRLLEGALHIPISLGSTHAAWEEASDAVAAPCQALEDALAHQPVLNGDETGFRTNGAKRYLWVLVAPLFVVYRLAPTRGAVVLRDLLGPVFAGILGSDRYVSYTSYHKGRLQFCWAHFTRDLLRAQALARTPAGVGPDAPPVPARASLSRRAAMPGRAPHPGAVGRQGAPAPAAALPARRGCPRQAG